MRRKELYLERLGRRGDSLALHGAAARDSTGEDEQRDEARVVGCSVLQRSRRWGEAGRDEFKRWRGGFSASKYASQEEDRKKMKKKKKKQT